MCVFCRRRFPKTELNRFVEKDGMITRDTKGTCPGRGAYCCRDTGCTLQADEDKTGLLKRALKIV